MKPQSSHLTKDTIEDYWWFFVWYHRLVGGYALHNLESHTDVAAKGRKLGFAGKLLLMLYGLACAAMQSKNYFTYLIAQMMQSEPDDGDGPQVDLFRRLRKSPLVYYMEIVVTFSVTCLFLLSTVIFNLCGARFGCFMTRLHQIRSRVSPMHVMPLKRRLLAIIVITTLIGILSNGLMVYSVIAATDFQHGHWWSHVVSLVAGIISQVILLSGFDFAAYFAVFLGGLCDALAQEIHQYTTGNLQRHLSTMKPTRDLIAWRMNQFYGTFAMIWKAFDEINAGMQSVLFVSIPATVITFSTACLMVTDQLSRGGLSFVYFISLFSLLGGLVFQLVVTCLANDWMNDQKAKLLAELSRPEVVQCETTGGLNLAGWDRLAARKMCFNPFGFFHIDKSLILTAGGLILTYCVILIQSNQVD